MFFYVDIPGPLQGLHPNTKTISLLSLFFAALLVEHPLWSIFPLLAALAALSLGGGLYNARRVAPLIAILFAVSIYIWTFMYFDPAAEYDWWFVGDYAFPRQTIMRGVGMGVRISAMLLMGLAFLSTTRVEDFTEGLNRMGLPYGLCFGLSLSFRLLPLFVGTAVTISEAQRSRGLDLESGSPIQKARKYVPLLVPVFISSMRNSDGLALALESKGFGRSNPRTSLRELPFGPSDTIALLLAIALVAGMLWARRAGYGML